VYSRKVVVENVRRALTLDLGDRREVWKLLARLSPLWRVQFIRRCCKMVGRTMGTEIQVTHHTGTVGEAWSDLMMLWVCHDLNPDRSVALLDRMVRATKF